MERLTEIISKKIISQEEGVCVGYILCPLIDFQTMSVYAFLVCDESEEKIKYLDFKSILSVNEFVMIKNSNMLAFGENYQNNSPIGKQVISLDGINLGRVIEIYLNNKKIQKLITEKSEICPQYISLWDGEYLIFSEKRIKRKKINNFQRIDKNIVQKVEIQNNKYAENTTKKNISVQLPYKANISSQKLIGKIAICDILGFNNELIVKKNEVITDRIITVAKKHNKLNHLLINCK